MQSAQILDFQEYRRRQILRDCGSASRPRQFLWMDAYGRTSIGTFRPAQSSAAETLRLHGKRIG